MVRDLRGTRIFQPQGTSQSPSPCGLYFFDGTLRAGAGYYGLNGQVMHKEHCAHIRAQAQALVLLARVQPDLKVARELEDIALNLLQSVHNLELILKPGTSA
jgi:hypothetical protein